VSIYEWALFSCGILAGITIWIGFYKKIAKQFFQHLEKIIESEVLKILVQAAAGVLIIFPNILLFNYGEINRNFMLLALGLTGILFGLWVFIPAEKISN